MPGIFISYRRLDSAGYAGRLFDRLAARFGRDRVFMDVDTIQLGQDFPTVLHERIGSCDALVALIGREWLTSAGPDGRRRLDNPADAVRMEITTALTRGIPVFPVLVQDAKIPSPEDLPEPLRALVRRQALALNHEEFDQDVRGLIRALEAVVPAAEARDISGQWKGEIRLDDGRTSPISFTFEVVGNTLMGSARYPTGSGGIRDGRIEGQRLSFATVHVPQFETREATIRYEGIIVGGQIQVVMQSDTGSRKLILIRAER